MCASTPYLQELGYKPSNFDKCATSRIFRADELPPQSVIVQKANSQFRPEGWKLVKTQDGNPTLAKPDSRPGMITSRIYVIPNENAADSWKTLPYRALNLSLQGKDHLTQAQMKTLESNIAIFVPKPAKTTDDILKQANYNLNRYKKLDLNITPNVYWNPTTANSPNDGKFPTKLFAAGDMAKKCSATDIFTKHDIPAGSLIVVLKGYQYRPDGWISLDSSLNSSNRPAMVVPSSDYSIVVVDDKWWGNFKYRAFNLSIPGHPVLTSKQLADMKHIFALYIPK